MIHGLRRDFPESEHHLTNRRPRITRAAAQSRGRNSAFRPPPRLPFETVRKRICSNFGKVVRSVWPSKIDPAVTQLCPPVDLRSKVHQRRHDNHECAQPPPPLPPNPNLYPTSIKSGFCSGTMVAGGASAIPSLPSSLSSSAESSSM